MEYEINDNHLLYRVYMSHIFSVKKLTLLLMSTMYTMYKSLT